MIELLAVIGLFFAGVVAVYYAGRGSGKDAVTKDVTRETLDDIYTAKQARDRYDADPDYALRMQDKYTRK